MNTMVATDNKQAEELERHREAYVLLFESLLKNRIADTGQMQARQAELKKIIDGIQDTDGFIDRLGDFGRILQLREDQLGGYIGQNFLKALSVVQERQKQAPRKNISSDAFAQDGPLIEALLSTFGPMVTAPDRFEMIDTGAVKLIRGGREILPKSALGSAGDAADFAAVGSTTESPASGANQTEEPTSTASDPAAALKLREEKSVIAEILERFGNILDIQGVLTPKDFSGDEEAFVVEEAVSSDEPVAHVELSIIEEIVQRFGNDLAVHEKLEPKEYSGDDDGFFDTTQSEATDSEEESYSSFEPIAVALTAFAGIRSRIAEFQKNQDRVGYQDYLSTASDDIKAVVALLNLSAKAKRQAVDMSDELYRLSMSLPYSQEQLEELFGRMDRYAKATALVNEFMAKVKQASAPVQMEMRKVWKQILDLLDEDPGEAVVKQRTKILLLAVNPAVKPTIGSGIMSLISKIYSL